MPWFINESDIERRGAVQLLYPCRNFPPAQVALQQLRSGASLEAVGQGLASSFGQQAERIEQLERELQLCQSEKNNWKDQLESYLADPLRERLDQTRRDLEEQKKRAERTEKNESELHTMLERERRLNADTIAQLKANVREQQAVIAQQHLKLQELLGTDTQIHSDPL